MVEPVEDLGRMQLVMPLPSLPTPPTLAKVSPTLKSALLPPMHTQMHTTIPMRKGIMDDYWSMKGLFLQTLLPRAIREPLRSRSDSLPRVAMPAPPIPLLESRLFLPWTTPEFPRGPLEASSMKIALLLTGLFAPSLRPLLPRHLLLLLLLLSVTWAADAVSCSRGLIQFIGIWRGRNRMRKRMIRLGILVSGRSIVRPVKGLKQR
jgi:hypothetical protein